MKLIFRNFNMQPVLYLLWNVSLLKIHKAQYSFFWYNLFFRRTQIIDFHFYIYNILLFSFFSFVNLNL